MIRRCAWCKQVIGEKEPMEDASETHGICEWCSEGLMLEIEAVRARSNQLENSDCGGCIPAESVV